jgi:hypothetical protein
MMRDKLCLGGRSSVASARQGYMLDRFISVGYPLRCMHDEGGPSKHLSLFTLQRMNLVESFLHNRLCSMYPNDHDGMCGVVRSSQRLVRNEVEKVEELYAGFLLRVLALSRCVPRRLCDVYVDGVKGLGENETPGRFLSSPPQQPRPFSTQVLNTNCSRWDRSAPITVIMSTAKLAAVYQVRF